MIHIKLLVPFCLSFAICFAQKPISLIEITPLIRYDSYHPFIFNWSGRVSTDTIQMKGISWGITAYYKKIIVKSFYLKGGIGYYRYSFSKLIKNNRFGESSRRPIAYPSPILKIFTTDKYAYNTVSANLGIENSFKLKPNVSLVAGILVNNYFTYSQFYHIAGDDIDYKVKERRFFANSFYFSIALIKKNKDVSVGPSLIIPVFDTWRQDKPFLEDEDLKREKWFNGLGLSITINKILKL